MNIATKISLSAWILAHLALILALPEQQALGQCAIAMDPEGYPQRPSGLITIGYGGAGYSKVDLYVPEPIPIMLDSADSDEILVYCQDACTRVGVPGTWHANWSVTLWTAGEGWGFLNGDGTPVGGLLGPDNVLFLPPRMAPSSSRDVELTCTLLDSCSVQGFEDNQEVITLNAHVETDLHGKYKVDLQILSGGASPISPKICDGGSGATICELSLNSSSHILPSAWIVDAPSAMALGELRMLQGGGEDLDKLILECGTPYGYEPVDSQFDAFVYCDELFYYWEVLGGVGGGVFLEQGRSGIFRATQIGLVDIRLTVYDASGEQTYVDWTVDVVPPRIELARFGGTLSVYFDATNRAYPPDHWFDGNGDGDGVDPATGVFPALVPVDLRSPIAYKAGDIPVIEKARIVCGPFTHTVAVTPSAVIRCKWVTSSRTFAGGSTFDVAANPAHLEGMEMEVETGAASLPGLVDYDPALQCEWSVSFADDYFVSAGNSDNRYYVVLKEPVRGALPVESTWQSWDTLYDVSCSAAKGASTEAEFLGDLWDDIAELSLSRKQYDAFNRPDNAELAYWGNGEGACQFLGEMLNPDHSDPQSNGTGSCRAFAELMDACLLLHGMDRGDGREIRVRGEPYGVPNDPAGPRILVRNWKVRAGGVICAGDDGIVETQKAAGTDDRQLIPLGVTVDPHLTGVTHPSGGDLPNPTNHDEHLICVSTGPDAILQTTPAGDDHPVVGFSIGVLPYWESLIMGFDIFPGPGVEAQNNEDPGSVFGNHFVLLVGGQVYDPSYGIGPHPFNASTLSCAGHENEAMAAFKGAGLTNAYSLNKSGDDLEYRDETNF